MKTIRMTIKLFFFSLCLIFVENSFAQIVNMNPDPNGDAWYAGGVPDLTPEIVERMNSIPELVLNPNASQITLPDSIDNSKNIYMRPIFNQYGGSCAQAAGVAYTYTYEVNYMYPLYQPRIVC